MAPMKPVEAERATLRLLISELTERMVKALDTPEGKKPSEGKETASFSDLKGALATVLDVYKTLNGTGDLDNSGHALDAYKGAFNHGNKRAAGRGNGSDRRSRAGNAGIRP